MKEPNFNKLPVKCFQKIISRNTFNALEIDIFEAVIKYSPNDEVIELLKHVDLSRIDSRNLLKEVAKNKFVSSDKILKALEDQLDKKVQPRVQKIPKANLMDKNLGIKVVIGGIFSPYSLQIIGVKLGFEEYVAINHIKFVLGEEYCPYVVEISKDNKEWDRIIDYSNYPCDGLQMLYFDEKIVK